MTLKNDFESHKKKQYENMYTDHNIFCCNIELKPTFSNITKFNYIEPIKLLSNIYKKSIPNYYEELISKYEKTKLNIPLYIKNSDYDLDEIMMQYVKCFDEMVVMIVWPSCKIKELDKTDFYNNIQTNGTIHAIKELDLTGRQMAGLIYQVYYDKPTFKDLQSIDGKLRQIDGKNSFNKIFIIFYEPSDIKLITGTDAPFKIKLRKILSNDPDRKLNSFLHVSDTHTHVCELAELFCNKNSLRTLQYQRLDRLFKYKFYNSLSLFMTYKKWLYENTESKFHGKFMIFSSMVLYSHGLREAHDLDLIVYKDDDIENKKIIDKLRLKYPFIETQMKIGDMWYNNDTPQEYMSEWFDKEWPAMYGARSMDDTIINPRFHGYYFGIKIISSAADIQRRIQRCRPAAYADLIALMILTKQDIKIPKLPEGFWEQHVYYNFDDRNKIKLVKTVVHYLKNRYNISVTTENVKKYLNL